MKQVQISKSQLVDVKLEDDVQGDEIDYSRFCVAPRKFEFCFDFLPLADASQFWDAALRNQSDTTRGSAASGL